MRPDVNGRAPEMMSNRAEREQCHFAIDLHSPWLSRATCKVYGPSSMPASVAGASVDGSRSARSRCS